MPFKKIISFLIIFLAAVSAFYFFKKYPDQRTFESNLPKEIKINNNGLQISLATSAKTVGDFLNDNKIFLSQYDQLFPEKETPLFSGAHIQIRKAVKISIAVDGKNIDAHTLQKDLASAIQENGIKLNPLDKISPDPKALPQENLKIIVTRINVEEKVIPEDIAFKTIEKPDNKLSWREKKIQQEGIKGIREITYKITYKNGKEISRIVLNKKITKEPVPEIAVQGTYMQLGKANKGQGTWYAWKGGLFAASTTAPKGSYVKVTNLANGKSVVVQINDYGPQGKGRIIDLDKIAFAKIASLGAGVIGVKVETVLN